MSIYLTVSRMTAEVLSPNTYDCECGPPTETTQRISAALRADSVMTGRLTHVPALRVRMGVDRMPELVGRLSNT